MDPHVPFREPVQASVLLEQLQHSQTESSSGLKYSRLQTGASDIDEYLLQGGIQRGCIVGLSSNGDGGQGSRVGRSGYMSAGDVAGGLNAGRLVTVHILAKELIDRSSSHASIIDATGSFPLSLLAEVIRWHVVKGSRIGPKKGLGFETEKSIDSKVTGILERVSITRVFDIQGLWEVLGEVNHIAKQTAAANGPEKVAATVAKESNTSYREPRALEKAEDDEQGHGESARTVTPEIMDSEEEDDDDDDDNLDAHRTPEQQIQSPLIISNANTSSHKASDIYAPAKVFERQLTTELVLVDNMTTLINDLFARTEKMAAHGLLTQLARTLTTLTHSSSLTVFLLNTLTKHPAGKTPNNPDRQVSVFAAMTATPSLGIVFDSFVDLHLLCHSLPARVCDAERFYGAESGSSEGNGDVGGGVDSNVRTERQGNGNLASGADEKILFANVVEVLKDECPQLDRWEGVSGDDRPSKFINREQRWATFKVTSGVGLANDNFV